MVVDSDEDEKDVIEENNKYRQVMDVQHIRLEKEHLAFKEPRKKRNCAPFTSRRSIRSLSL